MSGLTTVTGYTTDPISTNDVKLALRIPTGDATHDTLIGACKDAAIRTCMEYLQRTFTTETLQLGVDASPYNNSRDWDNNSYGALPMSEGLTTGPYMSISNREIYLPRPPLVSVSSIKTYDDSDTATTVSASTYYVDTQSPIGRVVLRTGSTWDNLLRVANAIEVTYVAGYGANATDVPAPIQRAMIIMATNYFENPEPVLKQESTNVVSGLLQSLLRPYQVSRFGIGFS